MSEQIKFWHWLIDAHEAAALLIVTDSMGSSPGKAGDKMAVTAKGSVGTIGGGLIEADLKETARSMMVRGETVPRVARRAHHPSTAVEPSGMICGGEQSVLIYVCQPEDKGLFQQLLQAYRTGTPLSLCISTEGLQILPPPNPESSPEFVNGEDWYYREIIGQCKRAFIIGGGHVSLALSKVLATLEFDITVIDDREAVDTMAENAYARQKWRVPYAQIAEHIPEGPDVFVFIMTHNHLGDEVALTQLLGKRLAYLGLLGSQHKIAQLKDRLLQKISAEQLRYLHAPMGLAIKSHTPAEIAISIAAELIQLNNN